MNDRNLTLQITISQRGLRWALALLGIATLLVPAAAWGGHDFDDVPNSNIFHDDIDWMADTGVTSGCGGDSFCPDDPVTRAQMAAFMHRLETKDIFRSGPSNCPAGRYVSGIKATGGVTCTDLPTIETIMADDVSFTLDDDDRFCVTDPYTPSRDGIMHAMATAGVEFDSSGGDFVTRVVQNVGGQNAYTVLHDRGDSNSNTLGTYAGDSGTGQDAGSSTYNITFDVKAGTQYRFAIEFREDNPGQVTSEAYCQLVLIDHPAP